MVTPSRYDEVQVVQTISDRETFDPATDSELSPETELAPVQGLEHGIHQHEK